MRCAFLTMDDTSGWCIDADLGVAPLERLGWSVEWVPWRRASVDWDRYRAVYVGVPWDYPEDPARFLDVLSAIDRSAATLVNDLSLVRWNLSKSYLRDLQTGGAPIVPSRWFESFDPAGVEGSFEWAGGGPIIVKPVVSTSAADTFLVAREEYSDLRPRLAKTFDDRPFVVQPFIRSIRDEGECSLFHLAGEFSHAIVKTPKAGDFRVQEEYGATIATLEPSAELIAAADRVLRLVAPAPVYSRCDFVRGRDRRFVLMELELIEPSLYLRTDSAAPERFAKAFDDYVRSTAPRGQTRFPQETRL